MLINVAQAVDLPFGLSESTASNFLPMILICIVFYLLIIRPHQLKLKKHKQMLDGITVGDRILTSGGIVGTVCRLSNEYDELLVEIAKNVKVSVAKSCIADVLKREQEKVSS